MIIIIKKIIIPREAARILNTPELIKYSRMNKIKMNLLSANITKWSNTLNLFKLFKLV